MCALASLSLEKTLATVIRRRVPEHVFQMCATQDRGFLENIVHLAQEVVPDLNITLADEHKHGDVYVVRLPASTTEISVHVRGGRRECGDPRGDREPPDRVLGGGHRAHFEAREAVLVAFGDERRQVHYRTFIVNITQPKRMRSYVAMDQS
jgi:hypothetical protein